MPIYEFKCPEGTVTEGFYSMSTVPDSVSCPSCDAPASRRISAVGLSKANSAAAKLIDSTQASAESPQVVSSIPGSASPTQRPTPVTRNPLHQKLPRP